MKKMFIVMIVVAMAVGAACGKKSAPAGPTPPPAGSADGSAAPTEPPADGSAAPTDEPPPAM